MSRVCTDRRYEPPVPLQHHIHVLHHTQQVKEATAAKKTGHVPLQHAFYLFFPGSFSEGLVLTSKYSVGKDLPEASSFHSLQPKSGLYNPTLGLYCPNTVKNKRNEKCEIMNNVYLKKNLNK